MREHGTRAMYVVEKCRCDECRTSQREYERARVRRTSPPYVGAGRVRTHILELQAAGVGLKRIAAVSGVSHSTVTKIIYGDPQRGQAPTKRVRPETERRILAVSSRDTADRAVINGEATFRNVETLLERGWTRAEIGRRVHGPGAKALQLSADFVTAKNARAVEALLDEPVPPRRTRWGFLDVGAPEEVDDVPAASPGVVDLPRLPAGLDESWRTQAACRRPEFPPWLFFPARGDNVTAQKAREVCARCPVHVECAAFAIAAGIRHGIFGGASENERRVIRREGAA